MQKALIILIAGVVFVGGAALTWFLLAPSQTSAPVTQTNDSSYTGIDNTSTVTPGGNTSNTPSAVREGYIEVTGELGAGIAVKDFKSDPATEKDKDGRHYYLTGGIDPSSTDSPYGISYTESDQSFSVVLLKEPLREFRKLAETELMNRLGINATEACGLRYWVSVPTWVNATFSTKNLGFSFCPGATQLP